MSSKVGLLGRSIPIKVEVKTPPKTGRLGDTRWASTNYKLGYNSSFRGYNPSYPFIRPFIGVITQFFNL